MLAAQSVQVVGYLVGLLILLGAIFSPVVWEARRAEPPPDDRGVVTDADVAMMAKLAIEVRISTPRWKR